MNKKAVITISILLPLVPLAFWIAGSLQEFQAGLGPAFLFLYTPARAFALVGFVLMFYQFVLAARIPALEAVIPRAEQLKSHRTLGKVGGVLILGHGLFMLAFDVLTMGSILFTLEKLLGIIGLFLLMTAVLAAWFFKPLQFNYKTWKKIHLLAYFAFPIVFVHAIMIGGTVRGYLAVRVLFALLLVGYLWILVRKLAGKGKPKPN